MSHWWVRVEVIGCSHVVVVVVVVWRFRNIWYTCGDSNGMRDNKVWGRGDASLYIESQPAQVMVIIESVCGFYGCIECERVAKLAKRSGQLCPCMSGAKCVICTHDWLKCFKPDKAEPAPQDSKNLPRNSLTPLTLGSWLQTRGSRRSLGCHPPSTGRSEELARKIIS